MDSIIACVYMWQTFPGIQLYFIVHMQLVLRLNEEKNCMYVDHNDFSSVPYIINILILNLPRLSQCSILLLQCIKLTETEILTFERQNR